MEFIQEITHLTKIKNGANVINLDEYADIGTHWIALYVLDIEIIFFLKVLEFNMFLKKEKKKKIMSKIHCCF